MGWFSITLAMLVTSLTMPFFHLVHADTSCSNPPPGVAKMVRGVDITTLDLVPMESLDQGFKSKILNFTCNQGLTWTSPAGQEYQLPDQIWQMTSTPGGWMAAHVDFFKASSDVRKSWTVKVGGGFSWSKFAFSSSRTYKKMQHAIINSSRFVEDVSAFESATRVDFLPEWVLQLDRLAQIFVDRFLDGTFESNKAGYDRFVRQFGTHYFATANFGGYMRTYMETNTSYAYSKSDKEVRMNAEASFLRIISLHGGTVSRLTTVSDAFQNATSTTYRYYGGDTNPLIDNIQNWQPTVDLDPWLFSGQLKPISNLISDPTTKASISKAVEEHVMRNYMEELIRLVNAAKQKVGTNAILNNFESRIDVMQGHAALDKSEVEALDNDIHHHLTVPSWFRDNTELCFKWWPDGDERQCGGKASQRLCAVPNARTPDYLDDTDRRRGGCRMEWGITSVDHPSWFNLVKICFRWYPDGSGDHCGGGASPLLCAPINQYTSNYRDDTDGSGSGCMMAWKIEVPSTAPLWMKTTKLCYHWYPTSDGGQCGPAPSGSMCAQSNEWTAYYRDDTDGRRGGCMMSWGLSVQDVRS